MYVIIFEAFLIQKIETLCRNWILFFKNTQFFVIFNVQSIRISEIASMRRKWTR